MSREDRKFIQFIVAAFLVVIAIMVLGSLLVDPDKPNDSNPTPTSTVPGPSFECQPYKDGVVCISATSVTR